MTDRKFQHLCTMARQYLDARDVTEWQFVFVLQVLESLMDFTEGELDYLDDIYHALYLEKPLSDGKSGHEQDHQEGAQAQSVCGS